jgi:glycerol dehydrogenase
MKQTAIFPGRYVQAEGAIADLGEEIHRLGSKALLIVGRTVENNIVPAYLTAWQRLVGVTVEQLGGESSEAEIERLASVAKEQGCDVVVGMGGGKAIDTAKAVGYAVEARTAIVPTIASTDAPTSAVAVIYTSDDAFLRYLLLPRNPDLVLVDTRVIAEAPVRYLVAGMGDALSTWFEADSCRTAYAPNQCGGLDGESSQRLEDRELLCYHWKTAVARSASVRSLRGKCRLTDQEAPPYWLRSVGRYSLMDREESS